MPAGVMLHENDPKQALLDEIGDLSEFEVFHNEVVVAVYFRPEKTAGGIILPNSNRDEDKYQSKTALVVKMGPDAFNDDTGTWFKGVNVKVGDWVWFKPSDGFNITVNKVLCRALKDQHIRGIVAHPDMVW